MRAGQVPTVVSGDCLVALGTLAGVQRAGVDAAMVWFDAHGDVHTLETTTSGYLGGLSLRLALGAHADLVAGPLGLEPLTPDRAVLVDARDLDPAEAAYLDTDGPARVAVDALDAATLPDGPLVLHVDVDVIDARELPGLLFPAPEGPSTDCGAGGGTPGPGHGPGRHGGHRLPVARRDLRPGRRHPRQSDRPSCILGRLTGCAASRDDNSAPMALRPVAEVLGLP